LFVAYCDLQPSFHRAAIGKNALGLLRQFELKLGRAATLEWSDLKYLLADLPSFIVIHKSHPLKIETNTRIV